MKRTILPILLILSLLLSGCSWSSGPYVSVTPHKAHRKNSQSDVLSASTYLELVEALTSIIADGTEAAAIIAADYPEDTVEYGVERAVQYAMTNDPIGAYAVEGIQYEFGTSSGIPAVSVSVTYHHSRSELQRIRTVADMEEAKTAVAAALESYATSLVMLVENYSYQDFAQFVQDYALQHPDTVMETPYVSEGVYGAGRNRVVELLFTYRTSRNSLRRMQEEVQPVFSAASLYVSGNGDDYQKLSQLYAFLMERFDYKEETSITPAYSLLRHGVGDSRAFAAVYAAMCRSAGLECLIVDGTRAGEPWTWNIVWDDGYYYHVDLLRSSDIGMYWEFTDAHMDYYVWDYTSYPACYGEPRRREDVTEPPPLEEPTEPTVPEETVPSTVPEETVPPTVPEETIPPTVPEETTPPTQPPTPSTPSTPTQPPEPTQPQVTTPEPGPTEPEEKSEKFEN